jgi:hypothetical protein
MRCMLHGISLCPPIRFRVLTLLLCSMYSYGCFVLFGRFAVAARKVEARNFGPIGGFAGSARTREPQRPGPLPALLTFGVDFQSCQLHFKTVCFATFQQRISTKRRHALTTTKPARPAEPPHRLLNRLSVLRANVRRRRPAAAATTTECCQRFKLVQGELRCRFVLFLRC